MKREPKQKPNLEDWTLQHTPSEIRNAPKEAQPLGKFGPRGLPGHTGGQGTESPSPESQISTPAAMPYLVLEGCISGPSRNHGDDISWPPVEHKLYNLVPKETEMQV